MGDLVSGTTNQEESIDYILPPTEELEWPQPQWLVSLIKWREENGGFFNYFSHSDEPEEDSYSHLDDSDPIDSLTKTFFKGMFFKLSPIFTGMGLIIAEGWRRHMRRKAITASSKQLSIHQESEEAGQGLGSPADQQESASPKLR